MIGYNNNKMMAFDPEPIENQPKTNIDIRKVYKFFITFQSKISREVKEKKVLSDVRIYRSTIENERKNDKNSDRDWPKVTHSRDNETTKLFLVTMATVIKFNKFNKVNR